MTRRFKRLRDFELALEIKSDDFIRPPRESQRNWLLNRALNEHAENLSALDTLARRMVPGIGAQQASDRSQGDLADDEIMEDWQIPLMQALADIVTASHGDVLEIGFGRGISAGFIQQRGVKSHTIIECNDAIVKRFEAWRATLPHREIRMVHGRWQDVLPDLGRYDGVFFHTYPLDETEFLEQIGDSVTFAEHFFPHAAAHLVDGGIFTYLSNEIDSLGRSHQRALLRHFRAIGIEVLHGLAVPRDTHDLWWSDSMVVVRATK